MSRRGYGIPYQGSKGAHAGRIYRCIAQRHPDARTLVDPFCGGWAVAHAFTRAGWTVHASDIDPYAVALLTAALAGQLGDWPSRWVDRSLFEACARDPDSTGFAPWEAGWVRCVWSFGNDARTYLYGRRITAAKQAEHDLVTCPGVVGADRSRLRHRGQRTRLAHLERAERIAGLAGAGQPPVVADYRDTLTRHATRGTVVYLDPPYAGTKPYPGAPTSDTAAFWGHAERAADAGAHVYVSEYAAPPNWRPVLTFTRQDRMATNKTGRATERLYVIDRPRHGHQP